MKKRFYNFIPLAAAVFALFLLCGGNRAATMPPDDTAAAGPETVAAVTAAGPETRAESEIPAGSAIAAAPVQTSMGRSCPVPSVSEYSGFNQSGFFRR